MTARCLARFTCDVCAHVHFAEWSSDRSPPPGWVVAPDFIVASPEEGGAVFATDLAVCPDCQSRVTIGDIARKLARS